MAVKLSRSNSSGIYTQLPSRYGLVKNIQLYLIALIDPIIAQLPH